MYCPQNVNYILLRIPENKGGPGNPSVPIDVNAFRTTNFRCCSAMRGAEFHGNTGRDGQPAYAVPTEDAGCAITAAIYVDLILQVKCTQSTESCDVWPILAQGCVLSVSAFQDSPCHNVQGLLVV